MGVGIDGGAVWGFYEVGGLGSCFFRVLGGIVEFSVGGLCHSTAAITVLFLVVFFGSTH